MQSFNKSLFILIIPALLFLGTFVSCKKDKLLTEGGSIAFSTDTLTFDTVFTSLGTVTRSFKIYNTNKSRIRINEISLQGGSTSPFRMNVDGTPTKKIENVELAAEDSLYVFVAATIDPTTGTMPFLVQDKVLVNLNGTTSEVPLEAYGQDAHYVVDSFLQTDTWSNDKPYVIIHSAAVDTGATLTIQKGCRIYMHADSKLYVAGTLKIFGTKTDSVIFQGDRLDRDYFGYKDYPGEWRGIHFLSTSDGNNLNHVIIKNGGGTDASIYVQPPVTPTTNMQVELNKCVIANSAGYGILGFNANVRATNCLVHTCGLQNLAILEGGNYELIHCTFATYGGLGINHAQQPTAIVFNYRDTSLTGFVAHDLNATFRNCIFYGPLDDEIVFNSKGSSAYNMNLQNCLLKRTNALPAIVSNNNGILNQDPEFKDYSNWNYLPLSSSPVKSAGVYDPFVIQDLDDNTRNNPPSIGAYEVN
ncbi:MAG: hypothetical protein JNJ58_05290 [Chitinophagaceae bacterium]|nr:hypothetical protein [Chitinophagaceae bacterium]